jgi:hypothetical protein
VAKGQGQAPSSGPLAPRPNPAASRS